MSHMKNAPLIYTIGMIQFPRVPDFERFIDGFMELVRKDYPLDDRWMAQTFNAQISSEGIKMEPLETKLWQLASIDRKWGFVLNEQALFLHTSHYHDFANFLKRFEVGITALINVASINIKWMSSVGIRYVNMISTAKGTSLEEYLKPWILPSGSAPMSLEVIQGIHTVRYKTKFGGLRLQALHNPTFTLPPELNSPFIVKNGWIKDKPTTEFALIDIDHVTTWQNPLIFDEKEALNALTNLRGISRTIFDSIGTTKAMKIWED